MDGTSWIWRNWRRAYRLWTAAHLTRRRTSLRACRLAVGLDAARASRWTVWTSRTKTVGTTVMNLSNESIEEFGISQSSLDPSTDLTSTGAVNIISKSGTNTFHGSGFGFWRRSDFAANNGALDQLNPAKPVFSRDDYGGRLGGPIFKDKLFGFLSYERQSRWVRLRLPCHQGRWMVSLVRSECQRMNT